MSGPAKVARWGLNFYAALGVIYLFLPMAWIVLFSFNEPEGRFNLVWQGFTLDNWRDPFSEQGLTDAFVESLKIAAISTVMTRTLLDRGFFRVRPPQHHDLAHLLDDRGIGPCRHRLGNFIT